ncbi:MAG TPA: MFS transporter [Ohtaekwangia sp.]|uniref:MFS transporter n=1 Tax=Ohtaekwangia sp. TaxID=2066019 RepID=UPI002F93DF66
MSTISPYAALQIRDYRYFISARFCITLAIQIQAVVVAWQVYEITKDALSLGLIGLAEAIPSIGVSLYAGHVADVVQRKKIITLCVTTLLLCSILLLFFTLEPGQFFLHMGVIPIYTVIFVSGVARGFLTPAVFAFMPQLVPRELYSNAITWNSTLWETASLSGPPLGGLLYGFFGISVAYATDALLVFAGLMLMFMVTDKPLPTVSEEEGIVEKIKAGLRFVFNNKIVLGAISLDLFAVLFGGAVALLPIFADTILHVGKIGLGFLRAAPGVGALLMALYLVHNPIKKNTGAILFYCVAGFGVCMILFGLSTSFWLSMFLLMMSGIFDCVSVIIRGTLLQTLTPENMKGRVSAVNHIFIGSSNEIGMFESGVAARLLGVVPSVIFGGFMTIGVVGITSWLSKSLRTLQRIE